MKETSKTFRQNKFKNSMLFIVCLIFVIGGVFMLKDVPLKGWFVIFFFGLGVIISLIQFHPNSSYLKLNDEGFEVKSLFRTSFTKWSDVKDFRKGSLHGNKMIFFDYADEHNKWKEGKKIAKFISGKEGAIQSTYTISTEDLIELMVTYKIKNS